MPHRHNTSEDFLSSYERILNELTALEYGASDDIFQTLADPLREEQLPINVPINHDEQEGYAATVSTIKYRLQSLLPVDQEGRPDTYMPPQLTEDLVDHFQLVVARMPLNEDPYTNLRRDRSEVAEFIHDVETGKACHFSDGFLRRLRPHIPFRWNLDCRFAKYLLKQGVCDKWGITLEDIEQDPAKRYYRFKHREDINDNPVAGIEMLLISMYLTRMSIKIASWLPYELMYIQVQPDARIHSAFSQGTRYDQYLVAPDEETFSDAYWHICLGHVLDWLEKRNWLPPVLCSSADIYQDWFWKAVDEGVDTWILDTRRNNSQQFRDGEMALMV
ncbi:MAG: hypothetical protein Q9170_004266 [Blastenia crenularia]